jgi:hypothetical protein
VPPPVPLLALPPIPPVPLVEEVVLVVVVEVPPEPPVPALLDEDVEPLLELELESESVSSPQALQSAAAMHIVMKPNDWSLRCVMAGG